MITYLIMFGIIVVLSYWLSRTIVSGSKKASKIIMVSIFALLTIFGGLRSIDLGYDAKMYIANTYRILENDKSLTSIFTYYGLEKGYVILMYIAHEITPDYWLGLLLLNALANIGPLYFIYKNREKASVFVAIPIFYCTLYLFSFNIMRQCVALSFFLIAISLIRERKCLAPVILLIIGYLFHRSIVFGVLLLIYVKIYRSRKLTSSSKALISILLLTATLIAVIFYEWLISALGQAGIINDRYASYTNEGSSTKLVSYNIEYSLLYLKAITIAICYVIQHSKKINAKDKNMNAPYQKSLSVDLVVSFLSFSLANTDRLTWYVYYPTLLLVAPQISVAFSKKSAFSAQVLVILLIMLYMCEKLITNQYNIIPYRMAF